MKHPAQEKARLRAEMIRLRDALPAPQRAEASRDIARCIAESDFYRNAEVILAYFAVKSEVDLTDLWQRTLAQKRQLAFARCVGKELHFHAVLSLSELTPGRFGIPEPPAEAPRVTDFSRALAVVPALSADSRGYRLGYGGGYYDRFLAEHPALFTVCAVFEPLRRESLCHEAFDRRMRCVVTEERKLDL